MHLHQERKESVLVAAHNVSGQTAVAECGSNTLRLTPTPS